MIKIAHVGDIHWGLGYAGPSPDSRFQDICRVMDWVADHIIEERCDLVLVAGDFFKDANVFLTRASVEIAACVAWLRKLSEAGIQGIAISGTPSHDAIAAYELLKEMRIPGVTICTAPDVITFENAVSIACLPGLSRSQIASKEEYSKLAPHEIHQLMTSKITQLVMGLAAECDYTPSILLAHITCVGADKGFEDLLQQQEPVLTKEAIEGSNFDLVCLGHIHRPQKIEGLSVPTFYCGSPERLRFDEEKNHPGFWIHEFDDSGQYQESRFIDTPARRFTTLTPLAEHIIEGLNFVAIEDAIVRLQYNATQEQAKLISPQLLTRQLYNAGAYYISEIKATIEKSSRVRSADATAEMTPLKALKLWCDVNELSVEKAAELIPLAEELVQEVGAL